MSVLFNIYIFNRQERSIRWRKGGRATAGRRCSSHLYILFIIYIINSIYIKTIIVSIIITINIEKMCKMEPKLLVTRLFARWRAPRTLLLIVDVLNYASNLH